MLLKSDLDFDPESISLIANPYPAKGHGKDPDPQYWDVAHREWVFYFLMFPVTLQ
jgi:hypothetical protein